MLEALIIISIVYACMLMPLRGKTYEQLTEGQRRTVNNNYVRYMRSRKGKKTPGMTIVEYLPILQKQALTYLITGICAIPIYVVVIIVLYIPYFLG